MSEVPKTVTSIDDVTADLGSRSVDSSPLAKIPLLRVIEVAKVCINQNDYEMFVKPYLEEHMNISVIAARYGLDVRSVFDILSAFEETIMDKHLETLPSGYGHAQRILARYTLSL